MREVEVKVRAKDLKAVEHKLAERGCVFGPLIHQHDVVYGFKNDKRAWEASREGDVILRIRREDSGAIFTLKQQRSNEMDNIEYETKIENPEAIHQSLLLMGYTPSVEVKKTRRIGKFQEYKISLDDVQELGTFVEIEELTDDHIDPAETQEKLLQILESLGLSRDDQEERGYDTQIYFLRKKSAD